jgi:hypothetical protein
MTVSVSLVYNYSSDSLGPCMYIRIIISSGAKSKFINEFYNDLVE